MRPTVYTSRPRDSYPARLLRALYSAIIPGVGQLVAGVRRRGFVLLAHLPRGVARRHHHRHPRHGRHPDVGRPAQGPPGPSLGQHRHHAGADVRRHRRLADRQGGHPQGRASLRPAHAPDRRGVGPDPRADRRSSRRGRLLHDRLPQPPHVGLRRRRDRPVPRLRAPPRHSPRAPPCPRTRPGALRRPLREVPRPPESPRPAKSRPPPSRCTSTARSALDSAPHRHRRRATGAPARAPTP